MFLKLLTKNSIVVSLRLLSWIVELEEATISELDFFIFGIKIKLLPDA
jgi:hypothetical protein